MPDNVGVGDVPLDPLAARDGRFSEPRANQPTPRLPLGDILLGGDPAIAVARLAALDMDRMHHAFAKNQ